MRPRLAVLALAPLLATAAMVPFAAPASAAVCAAVAVPPHFNELTFAIEAEGSFACNDSSTGLTVTVCIQEQYGGALGLVVNGTWDTVVCSDPVSGNGPQVTAKVALPQIPVYTTFFRTTVLGSTGAGDTAGAKSAPTPWFNCACYL
jgi:hypothetical protein